ncbi:3-alpha-(or 20-beta)-hydroxysteroid dehydrogenase [Bacillus sp. J14TS2]|uniref:SDR family NAD(P)-dependent oxidoreductase n=1 Tax=Bacillus sp. J14TS2 TaxID=2807188 RepID=UPI001B1DF2B1|nr:glucose 1-dehydrogenase [Bacillus sp. J14TS2]GIN72718.1 3-alpha-(or 20-beta)-hydroxysteroid dehydrogenase [Bacillus sp. J14TS2]
MGKLVGKVAIITGGARGMGASHVRQFVKEGAKVVFTDILVEEGEALAKELGDNAKFIRQDVTRAKDWDQVVAETEEAFGPINILVNNAGIAFHKLIEQMTEEEYRKVMDINQVSVFLGMKAVLSSMRKTENGSIVNISSINGLKGSVAAVAYSASKFAVRGMNKAAALEFAPYGIRVNSVHPGAIATPMIVQEDNKEMVEEFAQTIPLKRIAKPEEVTNMVLFLASDDSSYCTGSEFVVDGGSTTL